MQMAEELHEEVTKQEIKDMIRHCGGQGNGVITKEAFVAFNKRKNFE
jgi:Ca2+-binding EF-hand superfamily protein